MHTAHSGNSFQIFGKVSRLGDSAGDKTIVSRDKMQKNAKNRPTDKKLPEGNSLPYKQGNQS